MGKAYGELEEVDKLFFLSSHDDLSDAPRTRDDDNFVNEGTSLPITDYMSPFVGRSIPDVAFVLRDAREDIDLHRRLFLVIDGKSEDTDTITICRRGDVDYEGDEVQWYRIPANQSAMEMAAMEPYTFEEHKQSYDRQYPS